MANKKTQDIITFSELSQTIESLSAENILLLADPFVYQLNAISDMLAPVFEHRNSVKIELDTKLLSVESLEQTAAECAGFRPDCIIAIGGGTVLDTAKLINIMFSYNCNADDLISFSSTNLPLLPVVAVPTTSGTGSEATHFAVLYKENTKYSIIDQALIPDYVIHSPGLTYSMPKNLTAFTGFDALAQAVESYWSVNATDESKGYSREALTLITTHFHDAVLKNTPSGREGMQQAAYLAGKAINIAQTTAAHSISYPMSSFFGVPHGLAVFLTLPAIYDFNSNVTESDCSDSRGVLYVKKTMDELSEMINGTKTSPGEMLRSCFTAFSVNSHLSDYGITNREDINCVLDNGFNPQRMKNNPRHITRDDLLTILQGIL